MFNLKKQFHLTHPVCNTFMIARMYKMRLLSFVKNQNGYTFTELAIATSILTILFVAAINYYKDYFGLTMVTEALRSSHPTRQNFAIYYQYFGRWPGEDEIHLVNRINLAYTPKSNADKGMTYEYTGEGNFVINLKPHRIGPERTLSLRTPDSIEQGNRPFVWLCGYRDGKKFPYFNIRSENKTEMNPKLLPAACK